MRKQQIPLGIVLFSMVILTGCGGSNHTPELSSEVLSTEAQHETEKIAVTLVNASNLYLREVIFTVPEDETYEGYGALADVDGLDPGDEYVAEVPPRYRIRRTRSKPAMLTTGRGVSAERAVAQWRMVVSLYFCRKKMVRR